MFMFTRDDIVDLVKTKLDADSLKTNNTQFTQIVNCVWREINTKQQIVPFTNEQAANLRVSTLVRWYFNEFTGNHY